MKQAYYLAALSCVLAGPMGSHAQRGGGDHHYQQAPGPSPANASPATASPAIASPANASPANASPANASPASTTTTATSSSSSAAAPAAPATDDTSTGSQWCIDLSGDIDFYYTLQPPWGTNSSQGPLSFCPGDNADGGAIFIGTEANPEGGTTKLECTFNANQPNCDISLVDGYSVSVACTAPGGQTFGSSIDLWSQTCPDVVGSTCKNANGYAASQSDVAAFFQPAYPDYWIWVNGQTNNNDPTLKEVGTISCTVSNGKPSSKKEKREREEAAIVALKDAVEHFMEPRGLEELGIAKRHVHRARAHSRGLRELVGALKV